MYAAVPAPNRCVDIALLSSVILNLSFRACTEGKSAQTSLLFMDEIHSTQLRSCDGVVCGARAYVQASREIVKLENNHLIVVVTQERTMEELICSIVITQGLKKGFEEQGDEIAALAASSPFNIGLYPVAAAWRIGALFFTPLIAYHDMVVRRIQALTPCA